MQWDVDHDAGKDLNSEHDWIKEYGEPSRPTRNFSLYRIPLSGAKLTPVYYADTLCNKYGCGQTFPVFEFIDTGECWTERETAAQPGPNQLSSLVSINRETYVLEASTGGKYGEVELSKVPADIVPTRSPGDWLRCSIRPQVK